MKYLYLILFTLVSFNSFAAGPSQYSYDYQTGNSYQTHKQSNGEVNVQGNNYSNGTNWNTEIHQNGDQHGTDSSGNQWNYNKGSGIYQNYGTGETRYNQ